MVATGGLPTLVPTTMPIRYRAALTLRVLALLAACADGAIQAQTDYYNLDRGRPLRVEDALPIERHAVEWQLAPLRLSGAPRAGSTLELEPELAWGLLPRTQVGIGVPLARWRRGGREVVGGAGLDLHVLHALNVETTALPALAVAARALLPAGPLGPSRPIATVTLLATRTTTYGRLHVNVAATPGRVSPGDRLGDEASRWEIGLAADHAFVFQSLLVGADLVLRRPLEPAAGREATAGLGLRYQVGPRLAVDAGIGHSVREREWSVTFGSAVALSFLHRLRRTP